MLGKILFPLVFFVLPCDLAVWLAGGHLGAPSSVFPSVPAWLAIGVVAGLFSVAERAVMRWFFREAKRRGIDLAKQR